MNSNSNLTRVDWQGTSVAIWLVRTGICRGGSAQLVWLWLEPGLELRLGSGFGSADLGRTNCIERQRRGGGLPGGSSPEERMPATTVGRRYGAPPAWGRMATGTARAGDPDGGHGEASRGSERRRRALPKRQWQRRRCAVAAACLGPGGEGEKRGRRGRHGYKEEGGKAGATVDAAARFAAGTDVGVGRRQRWRQRWGPPVSDEGGERDAGLACCCC